MRLLVTLPALFPLKLSVKMGGILGTLAFDVFRVRRRVTLDNLRRAFGDQYGEVERVRLGRLSYVNFAKSMVEFASLGRLKGDKLRKLVRISGAENLDGPLSRGTGVIAITGHFGSWELLGASVAAHGYPVDFLVGEQTNRLVDDLMNDLRREAGIGTISRGVAARGVFDSLKKNRIVALLSDQDARKVGIFVDFFGTPASTFQGAAQFAYRVGCPIVCAFIVRMEDETHEAVLLPPIEVRAGEDREEEVSRITREHTRALEECVRSHPEQYFWAHRRWKTRPPDAP